VWNVSDVIVTDGDRGNAIGLLKWLAAKGIYPSPLEAGDLVEWIASRRVQVAAEERARMLPDVRAAMVEAVQKFAAVKATAYKLPNKCECSGSTACVCCNLLADIGECSTTLARLDAILEQGDAK
jgi:hypothetical protein